MNARLDGRISSGRGSTPSGSSPGTRHASAGTRAIGASFWIASSSSLIWARRARPIRGVVSMKPAATDRRLIFIFLSGPPMAFS